jgi:hypothetical protein
MTHALFVFFFPAATATAILAFIFAFCFGPGLLIVADY